MKLEPKNRFLRSTHAKPFADITASEAFHEACTVALAEMAKGLPTPETPAKGWDNASKLAGAREYLYILMNLTEIEKEPVKMTPKNLKPT